MIVAALARQGLLIRVAEKASEGHRNGWMPATWQVSEAGQQIEQPPVMIVDCKRGIITGVRLE